MGKASSAKKVARAARGGAAARKNRPKLGFPLAIAAVAVLGVGVVYLARDENTSLNSAAAAPIANQDHWHTAYGFYVCDKFLPAYQDLEGKPDVDGIHTHGDGVIHNHPFKNSAGGNNARLSKWAPMVGITWYDDGWKLPDGTEYRKGSATCGDKPAKIAAYRWMVDDPTAPIEVFESDFANIALKNDRDAITFAVLAEGATEPPPKPESVPELDQLTDMGGAAGAAGAPGGINLDPSTAVGGAGSPGVEVPSLDPATGGQPAAGSPTPAAPTDPATPAAPTP